MLYYQHRANNSVRKCWAKFMKEKTKVSAGKKIWNAITTVLVVLVVIVALLLVGARVVGLQVFTILSGSMDIKTPRLIQFNYSSADFAA